MFLIKKDWTISFSEIAEVSMVTFCLVFVVFLANVAIWLLSLSTSSLLTFCKIAEFGFQLNFMGLSSDLSVAKPFLLAESAIYFQNLPDSFDYWDLAMIF